MTTVHEDIARDATRLSQLQKRYARVLAMQANDPDRFKRNPQGSCYPIKDERYNAVIRHLRLTMLAHWEPHESHRIHVEERLTTLAEHALRERRMMAALRDRIPLLGGERLLWDKLDKAHTLIREALDIVKDGGKAIPFEEAEIVSEEEGLEADGQFLRNVA